MQNSLINKKNRTMKCNRAVLSEFGLVNGSVHNKPARRAEPSRTSKKAHKSVWAFTSMFNYLFLTCLFVLATQCVVRASRGRNQLFNEDLI